MPAQPVVDDDRPNNTHVAHESDGPFVSTGSGTSLNFIPETEPFHADIGDEQVKRRPLGSSEAHSADTPCADAEVAKCQQLSSMTLTYLGQGKYVEPGSLLPRFLSLPRRLRSPLRFSHIAWHSATH